MPTDRVVAHSGIISDRLAAALNRRTPIHKLQGRPMTECERAAHEGREPPTGHAGDLHAELREPNP